VGHHDRSAQPALGRWAYAVRDLEQRAGLILKPAVRAKPRVA